MKKCPYCAEEIQNEAILCRFCGRELESSQRDVRSRDEEVYYKSGNILITNARAVLMGKTYSLSNITSVNFIYKTPSSYVESALVILGILTICFGGGGLFLSLVVSANDANRIGLAVVFFIGIAITFIGSKLSKNLKNDYIVRIASASGETDGLVTKDKELAQKVTQALNTAIINRV